MSSGNINVELERSPVGMGINKVSQWVKASDMTDSSTTGSITLTQKIPAGAFVIGTKVTVKVAFDEDTSAALTVGKSAAGTEFTDAGSVSILAAGIVGKVATDPLEFIASATTVYAQVTTASDFTLCYASDGEILIEVFYLSTAVELTKGHPTRS